MGVEAMVDALDTKFSSLYKEQAFSTFMVRGQSAGLYKNAGMFAFLAPDMRFLPIRCV